MATKQKGTVKWFNKSKGYGFIAPEQGGDDIFVHYSGIAGSGFKLLTEGQEVEFVAEKVAKGWQASDVVSLSEAAVA